MPNPSSLAPTMSAEAVDTAPGAIDKGEVACECGCGRRFPYRARKRFAGDLCRVAWHRRSRDERDDRVAGLIRALYTVMVEERGR